MHLDKCQWKMVGSESFVLGISADRCGAVAAVRVLRPNRKSDLFLCECHLNEFISVWGLHNAVEILCQEAGFPAPMSDACVLCGGYGSQYRGCVP